MVVRQQNESTISVGSTVACETAAVKKEGAGSTEAEDLDQEPEDAAVLAFVDEGVTTDKRPERDDGKVGDNLRRKI